MAAPGSLVHIWYRCHGCGASPIVGLRYECQVCPVSPNNDLCEGCYRKFEQGALKHPVPSAHGAAPATTKHVFRAIEGVARESCLHWLAVPWSDAPAPSVPNHCVVRPEFCSGIDSYFGA